MKKSLRKVIVTLSAVAALSLAMGATAMADVTTSEINEGKATVTYTTQATAGEQVTVLLLKPTADTTDGIAADEIAYIDQKAAGTDGSVEFVMPITGVEEGQKYSLMSGSETATEVASGEANFASEEVIHYGDANNDSAIDAKDSMQILLYTINKGVIVGDDAAKARADVNVDTAVDAKDSMQVLLYTINKGVIVSGDLDSWMTAE